MSEPRVTVVVPTLVAGPVLDECLRSLAAQTVADFETVIVDNSGHGAVRGSEAGRLAGHLIENDHNLGFGAALNQAARLSRTPFVATLNDDAVACSGWLEALLAAIESDPKAGMAASRVLLAGTTLLDSAGMLMASDGSSKQRGHGLQSDMYGQFEEVLFPSGSAAIYRRRMLEDTGGFDEQFFLYCEDTDLGLRAVWRGWRCLYVPGAVVEHRYSHSAGRASALKAYLVERNRLFTVVKNFPARQLLQVPFVSAARYFWHTVSIATGGGKAAEFGRQGGTPLRLAWFVLRAHAALLARLARLLGQRREILGTARISAGEFRMLLRRHHITARQVASL